MKCVQATLPEKSVRTINFGSAAGCEGLRVCPRFGLWRLKMRAKPEPGGTVAVRRTERLLRLVSTRLRLSRLM